MPGDIPDESDGERVSYETFGQRFFEHAVTAPRILAALEGIAGDEIAFGPIGAGPGRFAQVRASGVIGEPSATRLPGELVAFRLAIPVTLDLDIDLGLDHQKFHAAVSVGLTLTARAAEPLRVVIDIEAPTWKDVTVAVEAEGIRAALLQRLSGMDREIGVFVAKYVARELDKPHITAARDIDVAARIDGAWAR